MARTSEARTIPPKAFTPRTGPTVQRISATSSRMTPPVPKPVEVFTNVLYHLNQIIRAERGSPENWRRHMGIEPTSHNSRRSSTGFEDQAHHQTGRASSWATARLNVHPSAMSGKGQGRSNPRNRSEQSVTNVTLPVKVTRRGYLNYSNLETALPQNTRTFCL